MTRSLHYLVRSTVLGFLFGFASLTLAADGSVALEVATGSGFQMEQAGKWVQGLSKAGFSNVRIRSQKPGENPSLDKLEGTLGYRAVAIVSDGNLKLPGGASFRLEDQEGMKKWIASLADAGEEGIAPTRARFGLTNTQMDDLVERMKRVVPHSTKGRPTKEVAKEIMDLLELPLVAGAEAKAAIRDSEPCVDEFEGLSAGSTLAALVRPLGLVITPEKPIGKALSLRLQDSQEAKDSWPAGWESKNPRATVAPQLSKTLNFVMDSAILGEGLEALQGRIGLPVILDQNGIARARADLAKSKVSVKKGRMTYSSALSQMLAKAKLKYELRVDENEKPFLWITGF